VKVDDQICPFTVNLIPKFLQNLIDSIEIVGDRMIASRYPVGEVMWVSQSSNDYSASVLSYFFIVVKKLFLNISVFGLFGSKRVH